ncbi:hypothetical protein JFU47_01485 [Pseudomonas sp. TH39(2020)]|uniref:hypothetical protein n=1 Tax=Pseudomonas sp. TH39(2020) TaxID=2796349 RepID=UPI001914C0D8|nr:hypothetical protein [Pseudomonas sp. TH39(2020)]MBK5395420.1 hypothetical protein [Pseudomonas sp. TH39(2020)]
MQTTLACYLLGNNVENLTYTGSSFTGADNPLTNTISGRTGNDSLVALDGDDVFVLAAGFSADLVFGFDAAGGRAVRTRPDGHLGDKYWTATSASHLTIADVSTNIRLLHVWGARGRVFESLRPDHIYQ